MAKVKIFFLAILSFGFFGLAKHSFAAQTIFFTENFDVADPSSHDWYDQGENGTWGLDNTNYPPGIGVSSSFKCNFTTGHSNCDSPNDGAFRRVINSNGSSSVYVSFYVKHSSSWVGSGVDFHPHLIYILSDKDYAASAYGGLAVTWLDAYVEENRGYPQLNLQDGLAIDTSNIEHDLSTTTENRAVHGCNGDQNLSQDYIDCYPYSSPYYTNGDDWKGPMAYFFDPTAKVQWHHIEAYYKMNTWTGGVANADGVAQYWYDGTLQIDKHNVVLAAGISQNIKFKEFVLSPYIQPNDNSGSPANQTIWYANLVVADKPTSGGGGDTTPPAAPSGLSVS